MNAKPFDTYFDDTLLTERALMTLLFQLRSFFSLPKLLYNRHRFKRQNLRISELFILRGIIYGSKLFDPVFYLDKNPDIDFTGIDLLDHYIMRGGREGRSASALFDPRTYCARNQDPLDSNFHPLEHFIKRNPTKFKDEKYKETSIYSEKEPNKSIKVKKRNLCMAHIFYHDVWPSLIPSIRHAQYIGFDICINIVSKRENENLHIDINNEFPNAKIIYSENKGRDIGGHFNTLKNIEINNYSNVFLIHTKQSKHLEKNESKLWRDDLINCIARNKNKIEENIYLLDHNPGIGMIASEKHRCTEIGSNTKHYDRILKKLNVPKLHANCEFVAGTMMLIRAEILGELHERLKDEKFETSENRDINWLADGQIEHAIERAIGNLVRARHYRILWRP